MRVFVAVYPPPEAVEHLAAMVGGLALARPTGPGKSVRLASSERWHVTLAFSGDVPDPDDASPTPARVDATGKAIQAIEAVGAQTAPARVRIAGGGRFGRGRFTVVWAGLRGDLEGLTSLATTTRRELKRARVPFDRQPFKPHLTIARPGDRLPVDELASDIERLDAYEGPLWTIEQVCLMRSFLGPRPRYETLAAARMAATR